MNSKKNDVSNKKGKDADVERWEADVRKNLQNKKPASSVTLSRAEVALVEKQLKAESKIRDRVNSIRNELLQGLSTIRSIIKANVEEFHVNIWTVVSLLLDGVVKFGSALVADDILSVFLVSGMFEYFLFSFNSALSRNWPHVARTGWAS